MTAEEFVALCFASTKAFYGLSETPTSDPDVLVQYNFHVGEFPVEYTYLRRNMPVFPGARITMYMPRPIIALGSQQGERHETIYRWEVKPTPAELVKLRLYL